MEVFCITPQKKSPLMTFAGWFSLILAILSLFLCCGLANIWIFVATVIFGFLFWFLTFRCDFEYECSYFDGDFRFARIRHKSSRKALKHYSVEDLMQIAPSGDRSVYKYENDSSVKVLDYSSKQKESSCYDMIFKTTDGVTLYKTELDKKYLDTVCIKYSYKVIRRKENE